MTRRQLSIAPSQCPYLRCGLAGDPVARNVAAPLLADPVPQRLSGMKCTFPRKEVRINRGTVHEPSALGWVGSIRSLSFTEIFVELVMVCRSESRPASG